MQLFAVTFLGSENSHVAFPRLARCCLARVSRKLEPRILGGIRVFVQVFSH